MTRNRIAVTAAMIVVTIGAVFSAPKAAAFDKLCYPAASPSPRASGTGRPCPSSRIAAPVRVVLVTLPPTDTQ